MSPRSMSKRSQQLNALLAELAPVRDEDLVGEVRSARAVGLLGAILEAPTNDREAERSGSRRGRMLVFAAAAVAAAVLSLPAFGVGEEVVSFFAGWRDPEAPVPTASDVLIASGEDGVRWQLVATKSDQGLCLGLVYRSSAGEEVVDGGCGYVDLRGDLTSGIRGDPSTRCLVSPTETAPCGSLPRRWIDFPSRSDGPDSDRMIVFGSAAAGVAGVDLVLSNGESVRAHVVEAPERLGAPLNFYWVAVSLEEGYRGSFELVDPVEMVVARDADGRVLERRIAAWNGNPTGDPDGSPPPQPLG
jgi:hypothetical protein